MVHKCRPCKPLKKKKIRKLLKATFFGVNFAEEISVRLKFGASTRDLGESEK